MNGAGIDLGRRVFAMVDSDGRRGRHGSAAAATAAAMDTPQAGGEAALSIVIVNWNTCDLLARCLASIEAHSPAEARQVLVVDNASSDRSTEMVRERFPWVRLIENAQNVGFARANNQAIRQASGRYVLLLNSDTALAPSAVPSMIACLEDDPQVGIVSVCLAFPDGSAQFCGGSFPTLYSEGRSLFGLHRWDLSLWGQLEVVREVDWVSGACLMARKRTLDQIGLFDERFFMFGEEVDLCYRAVQAGWKVCLVRSEPVIHVRAGSSGKTSRRILRLYRGKLQYFRKHLGPVRRWLLAGMMLVSATAKLAAYALLSPLRVQFAERRRLWWGVLRGLVQATSDAEPATRADGKGGPHA